MNEIQNRVLMDEDGWCFDSRQDRIENLEFSELKVTAAAAEVTDGQWMRTMMDI